MVLICPKCEARLQLDEAKAPSRPFTVRCPKCQTNVNAQPATATGGEPDVPAVVASPEVTSVPSRSPFERPATAPLFRTDNDHSNAPPAAGAAGLNDIAKLLADALRHSGGQPGASRGRTRAAWDRRKILVCASPAYRELLALSLAERDHAA